MRQAIKPDYKSLLLYLGYPIPALNKRCANEGSCEDFCSLCFGHAKPGASQSPRLHQKEENP